MNKRRTKPPRPSLDDLATCQDTASKDQWTLPRCNTPGNKPMEKARVAKNWCLFRQEVAGSNSIRYSLVVCSSLCLRCQTRCEVDCCCRCCLRAFLSHFILIFVCNCCPSCPRKNSAPEEYFFVSIASSVATSFIFRSRGGRVYSRGF